MISDDLFVWVFLPGHAQPVVAGRLTLVQTAAGKLGHFTYGRSYLARSDAIPLGSVDIHPPVALAALWAGSKAQRRSQGGPLTRSCNAAPRPKHPSPEG